MRNPTQTGIWETDVRSLDLENPRVLKWYLEKKIQAGDWQAIDRKSLKRVLPSLNINPALRKLLEHYVDHYSKPTRPAGRRRAK